MDKSLLLLKLKEYEYTHTQAYGKENWHIHTTHLRMSIKNLLRLINEMNLTCESGDREEKKQAGNVWTLINITLHCIEFLGYWHYVHIDASTFTLLLFFIDELGYKQT